MSRTNVTITNEWQLLSNKPALFEIMQEATGSENKGILFNSVPDADGAERVRGGNIGLQLRQNAPGETYVKSDIKGVIKNPYIVAVIANVG